jgi:MinD-like ATPase involved in chromosome partitioning or flagellar assembly
MVDQAHDLRRLAKERGRPKTVMAAGRPTLLVLTGGTRGVGTTTVAMNLATALARAGRRTLLVDADPGGSNAALRCGIDKRHTSVATERLLELLDDSRLHADVAVIDVGSDPDQTGQRICQMADAIVMVTTTETAAVVGTFAAIKTLVHSTGDRGGTGATESMLPLYLLVNMAPTVCDAETVQYRLGRACRRLLGIRLAGVDVAGTCLAAAGTAARATKTTLPGVNVAEACLAAAGTAARATY